MLQALKKRSVIIFALMLSFLVIAFFVVSIVLEQAYVLDLPYNLPITLVFILVVLLLIAYEVGNITATRYRKKHKLWAGALPEEIRQRAWDLRTPWLIACIVTTLIAILDSIIWRL